MLKLDDCLILQPDVLVQKMGGEMVVVLPERAEFVVLNESGSFLLGQMRSGVTTRQLVGELSTRYGIAPDQAKMDIFMWVSELIAANICAATTSKT